MVVGAALIAQLVLILNGGADASSSQAHVHVPVAWKVLRFFSYFTIQSNIVVLAAATTLAVAPDRDGRLWRVLRLDSLMGIFITGLVYVAVLAPVIHLSGLAQWINIGLHYFAPCWTLVGWLLLGPRPRIATATVVGAFVWPVAWIAYTFAHGAISGWYPYPFLDVGLHGYGVAVRNTAVVLVIGVVIGFVFKLLDRLPVYSDRLD